jgi:hypothetical protein
MLAKRLLMTVAVFGLLGANNQAASEVSPTIGAKTKQRVFFPNRAAALLYDQSDNDNGSGIVSANFLDTGFDAYDAEGADDFTVPVGKTWTITEIYVDGTYFDGAGSAESFNVTFYKSKNGKVRKAIRSCINAPYRFDTHFDNGSDYVACKTKLEAGTYFVSVQANTFFSTAGEWGWLTNNTVRYSKSKWRNPGDGFATGCTNFGSTLKCVPVDEGGDYSFAFYGKERDASMENSN